MRIIKELPHSPKKYLFSDKLLILEFFLLKKIIQLVTRPTQNKQINSTRSTSIAKSISFSSRIHVSRFYSISINHRHRTEIIQLVRLLSSKSRPFSEIRWRETRRSIQIRTSGWIDRAGWKKSWDRWRGWWQNERNAKRARPVVTWKGPQWLSTGRTHLIHDLISHPVTN